jgi:hypothetical protein
MKNAKNSLPRKSKLILPAVAVVAGVAGASYAWRRLLKRSLPNMKSRFTL